jgi:hypothetical protein
MIFVHSCELIDDEWIAYEAVLHICVLVADFYFICTTDLSLVHDLLGRSPCPTFCTDNELYSSKVCLVQTGLAQTNLFSFHNLVICFGSFHFNRVVPFQSGVARIEKNVDQHIDDICNRVEYCID